MKLREILGLTLSTLLINNLVYSAELELSDLLLSSEEEITFGNADIGKFEKLKAIKAKRKGSPELSNALDGNSLSREIIRFDISKMATLLSIAKELLQNIQQSLRTNSTNPDAKADSFIYNEIAKALIDDLEKFSKLDTYHNLQESCLQESCENFNAMLDKATEIGKKQHPLAQACEYIKYFLQFSVAIADARVFLRDNEEMIKEFYSKGLKISGSAAVEASPDPMNTIKVGAKIHAKQSTGSTNRGIYNETTVGTNISATTNANLANIKGNIGTSFENKTFATGMNASHLLKNTTVNKTKRVVLDKNSAYTIFNKKRDKVVNMSKSLGRYISDFEKLFKRYFGFTNVKITFSYKDPKYNLEKVKGISLSGGISGSANKLSGILDFKVDSKYKNITYIKDNDIYNFLQNQDLSHTARDYSLLKQVSMICDKYDVIKSAYNENNICDYFTLSECCNKYFKKHGNFNNIDDFVTTLEYYAEVLQNYNTKKQNEELRSIKSKIEKILKVNGRRNFLLTSYFMGISYLVLANQETNQNIKNRMQSALEKISLLLEESRAFFNKQKEIRKTCNASQKTLKISFADKIIELSVKKLDNSPYIHENGYDINIDLDITKVNKIYQKIVSADTIYNKGEALLGENNIKKMLICLNAVAQILQDSKNVIIEHIRNEFNQNGDEDNIFDQIMLAFNNIRTNIENNKTKMSEKSQIMRLSQALKMVGALLINQQNKIRFVFKKSELFKENKLEFLGIKVLTSITRSANLSVPSYVNIPYLDAKIKANLTHSYASNFAVSNAKSLFIALQNVIDCCFLKEADFGSVQYLACYDSLRKLPTDYLNNITSNFKKGLFWKQIKEGVKIYAFNNLTATENALLENIEYYTKNSSDITESDVLYVLSIYGMLLYERVAKPYYEHIYQ